MPNDESKTAGSGVPHFDSTQWSLVMAAQHRSSPEGRVAFSRLCEKYWYPLYAHARRLEGDVHRARDLTQSFFAKVMEKNYISDADPSRGRFRTFMLTSLTHFISNEWDKARAMKRGGDRVHFSLEFDDGDRRFSREPVDGLTPEKQYERRWAVTLLNQVLIQLQTEYRANGKEQIFSQLQQFLTANGTEKYVDVGERMEMSEGAVKVAVHRLRARYQQKLRDEIAETVSDQNDVDDEIRRLFETFSL